MTLAKFVLMAAAASLASAGCSVARSETGSTVEKGTVEARSSVVETPTPAPKPAANVAAAGVTPEAVVADLYKVHAEEFRTNRYRIMSGKDRKILDKYFDKNLADLIWKDLTTHQGEVGVLDFDPFYDTQDPDIKNLKVSPGVISGETATASVSFTNSGRKETLVYSLIKQNGAWRISDIKYPTGDTLLKFFKEGA